MALALEGYSEREGTEASGRLGMQSARHEKQVNSIAKRRNSRTEACAR